MPIYSLGLRHRSLSSRSSPSGGPNEPDAKRQNITGREDGRREKMGSEYRTPHLDQCSQLDATRLLPSSPLSSAAGFDVYIRVKAQRAYMEEVAKMKGAKPEMLIEAVEAVDRS